MGVLVFEWPIHLTKLDLKLIRSYKAPYKVCTTLKVKYVIYVKVVLIFYDNECLCQSTSFNLPFFVSTRAVKLSTQSPSL